MDLQSLFIPLLIVLFAIPLVLQARKQKRTMREQQQLQNSLGVGDRVMTTSGLFGTVVGTADDNIDLEVSPGVTTTWLRQAIREKVNTESSAAEESQVAEQSEAKQQASTAEEPESGASSDATSSGASSESDAQVAEPIEQQKTT